MKKTELSWAGHTAAEEEKEEEKIGQTVSEEKSTEKDEKPLNVAWAEGMSAKFVRQKHEISATAFKYNLEVFKTNKTGQISRAQANSHVRAQQK